MYTKKEKEKYIEGFNNFNFNINNDVITIGDYDNKITLELINLDNYKLVKFKYKNYEELILRSEIDYIIKQVNDFINLKSTLISFDSNEIHPYVLTNKQYSKDDIIGMLDKEYGKYKDNLKVKIYNYNKDYEYMITKEDIDLKRDYDYEEYHSHENYIFDNKHRRHNLFIYQDSRSVDGYDGDSGFYLNEIVERLDYDYYKDNRNLFRINKDTKNTQIFVCYNDGGYYNNYEWLNVNIKIENLNKINNFIEVINYFDKASISL